MSHHRARVEEVHEGEEYDDDGPQDLYGGDDDGQYPPDSDRYTDNVHAESHGYGHRDDVDVMEGDEGGEGETGEYYGEGEGSEYRDTGRRGVDAGNDPMSTDRSGNDHGGDQESEPQSDQQGNVVVCELLFLPDDTRFTKTFPAGMSLGALRDSIARSFNLRPEDVDVGLSRNYSSDTNGKVSMLSVPDTQQLGQLTQSVGAVVGGMEVGTSNQPLKIVVEILANLEGEGNDGGNRSSSSNSSSSSSNESGEEGKGGAVSSDGMLNAPVQVIRVVIDDEENGNTQIVYVKIISEDALLGKRFIGGYRNKRTGTVSHHAFTQTPKRNKVASTLKFHRETQTVDTITRSQQTTREVGVQMERPGVYVSKKNDKIIIPRPYVTAHQVALEKHQKAIELQCFLRVCFARRRIRRLIEDSEQRERTVRELKEKEERERKAEIEKQTEHRIHPKTKEDFDTLHRELEAWRLHEIARIKGAGLSEEETQFRLQEVLGKEVVVLQIIDRLKKQADAQNALEKTDRILDKMASAKAWTAGDGDVVEVETPLTRRARELVVIYKGLCDTSLSLTERKDVLLTVKYAVKEFDCQLTRDILTLIAREEDLLSRNRSPQSLAGLRKRISQLFLDFIYVPQFNPEAAAFVRSTASMVAATAPISQSTQNTNQSTG